MQKLDWYIIKKFLGTFFFSISLILLIVVVFDMSEKIDDFIEKEAPIKAIIFDYYLNFIPYFGNLFSPLFTFVAVIFFTSKMANNTEVISILSSGVSFNRFLRPYMLSAGLLAILSFTLGNFIIPPANSERLAFENTYIKNPYNNRDKDIHMQIMPGQFIYMQSYNTKRNIGYKFSINNKYKYILRVDNDVFIEKNCIQKLLGNLRDEKIAAISPKILHGHLTETVWWSEFYMNWFYLKFQGTVNAKKKRFLNNKKLIKIKQVDAIAGACSAYNTKILSKTGLGDEDFFYGPEDIELSYRLKKNGKLFVNQKAIAFHKIATSSSISGVKNRTFQSTYGFLKLIEKIGTKSDKLIGYLYFILRLLYYKFIKQKEYYAGYSFALKKFFFNKT